MYDTIIEFNSPIDTEPKAPTTKALSHEGKIGCD